MKKLYALLLVGALLPLTAFADPCDDVAYSRVGTSVTISGVNACLVQQGADNEPWSVGFWKEGDIEPTAYSPWQPVGSDEANVWLALPRASYEAVELRVDPDGGVIYLEGTPGGGSLFTVDSLIPSGGAVASFSQFSEWSSEAFDSYSPAMLIIIPGAIIGALLVLYVLSAILKGAHLVLGKKGKRGFPSSRALDKQNAQFYVRHKFGGYRKRP